MKVSLISLYLLCSTIAFAQQAQIIKYSDLENMIGDKEKNLQIINFWATWCKPCVQELPFFEALQQKFPTQVKVVLVSFDMAEEKDSKVLPFLEKRNIQSEVKILDETDFNAIISEISPDWSGAIPATLIIDNKNDTKEFYEKAFEEGELEEIVMDHLRQE